MLAELEIGDRRESQSPISASEGVPKLPAMRPEGANSA